MKVISVQIRMDSVLLTVEICAMFVSADFGQLCFDIICDRSSSGRYFFGRILAFGVRFIVSFFVELLRSWSSVVLQKPSFVMSASLCEEFVAFIEFVCRLFVQFLYLLIASGH